MSGHGTWREQIEQALTTVIQDANPTWEGLDKPRRLAQLATNAVLPILDAARTETAETIAQAMRDLPHGQTNSTPWVPDFDAGWRHGRMDCLAVVQTIARQHEEEK